MNPHSQKPGFLDNTFALHLVGCADLRGTQRFCWVALSRSPTYEWYFYLGEGIVRKTGFLNSQSCQLTT